MFLVNLRLNIFFSLFNFPVFLIWRSSYDQKFLFQFFFFKFKIPFFEICLQFQTRINFSDFLLIFLLPSSEAGIGIFKLESFDQNKKSSTITASAAGHSITLFWLRKKLISFYFYIAAVEILVYT